MGEKTPYSSLTHFAASPSINLTIICLIIIGGIGFLTWEDIRTKKFRIRKYRMQTKVILVTTGVLILLPALYFFLYEFRDMPLGQRVLCAMFQAVTPRTAGFNTVDFGRLGGNAIGILVLLMLVGALQAPPQAVLRPLRWR